ncbi:MAG: hypothetical protein KKD44_28090, partial [Proteobacteria bacterium]|nr:hypothetical protein [Pseudomonadota bacterium]
TYALAGTGFESDGTPIIRAKGRNWEEQYTEFLMYLATAEALGCTYQGQFSRLKDKKSQTEVSKALLDDLSTDLRKMTLYRSALGPRHLVVVRDVDSKIKALALEIQLANMEWDYGNMDRALELKDRYDKLAPKEKEDLDALVEKVRIDKTFKMTAGEEKSFFFPPTEKQLDNIRRLTGIREGKPKALETLINDRKAIIQASYPTEITLRASADKVAAGLNDVSKEVFGDLEEEKGAMRTLLAESLSLYSKDNKIDSDTLSALVADEKHNFAKILEILGRLRIARESSEQQSIRDFRVDENIKKSAEARTERDVLDLMAKEFVSDADQEVMTESIKKSLDALFIHAKQAKTFDETKAVNDKIKAYKELYALFGKTPLMVAGQDLASMKAPRIKKPPEPQLVSEPKKIPNIRVRKPL